MKGSGGKLDEAITIGEEQYQMKRLEKAIEENDPISKDDIAKILRVTTDVDIPKTVRLYIADRLDKDKKTGRSRPLNLFPSAEDVFRDISVRDRYKKYKDEGLSSKDALDKTASDFCKSYERIRQIVYSK